MGDFLYAETKEEPPAPLHVFYVDLGAKTGGIAIYHARQPDELVAERTHDGHATRNDDVGKVERGILALAARLYAVVGVNRQLGHRRKVNEPPFLQYEVVAVTAADCPTCLTFIRALSLAP